ncbi:lytic transglycosylase domain-containing protein [Nocardioides sp. 1609]|uniref:aggregation-promoting factor C-terminal-like domain-containing protein n=1 Tax=Nocardioides sp. 1609 TaxID=2508327 RepID=UPI001FD66B22|nr:lytic transglycosylase domain-containing protein [Nocardioides sp. 1609]
MKHVPKHRGAPARPAVTTAVAGAVAEAPRKIVGTTVILSSLAVAATGVTITGGLVATSPGSTAAAVDQANPVGADTAADDATTDPGSPVDSSTDSPVDSAEQTAADVAELAAAVEPATRTPVLSRSADRRQATDPLKEAALAAEAAGPAEAGSQDLSDADPRDIARALLAEFGFSADQFGCLDSLYTRESGWNVYADNPSSSAYGIPQSLPGSKMASAGADWATNPVTQIRWGLGYIEDRYGSPCGAWAHSESHGWY